MAENTFAVTQHLPGIPPRIDWVNTRLLQKNKNAFPETADKERATAMVSCGITISGTEIRVVGDRGEVLAERLIGEVALKSNCMLTEYYHRPDLTSQAIQDGWYFTGDMGYIADGELYITGRKKDLILVGGKNIYPQDLEAIANSLPGFVPGRNAAFGVFDPNLGSENVVMVCEMENPEAADDQKKDLELLLRKAIVQQSEIALSDVRFVQKRWLIKTSSGKISRASNREKYLREYIENI
jgi:fatty-acyl-CoA synthase